VDHVPIIGRGDEYHLLRTFEAQYDAPAYVRRAREVEAAWEQLLYRCRQQRDEWLLMVRVRLGLLRGLAGRWEALLPLLADEAEVAVLGRLEEELRPRLRSPVEPTSSARVLRRALRELAESLERFNGRWRAFLPEVDLTRVNQLREGYNCYYLLEKECAVRSASVARRGFRKLAPATPADVGAALPLLPVPRLMDERRGLFGA
jgi:hypothetical protein